ncbi:AraC family transcriptional regulator [Phenylobacterium sp.]|jgi:AraC-like DNA-binding protein|uniref:AraC family transcriptional regulator n=1 Tax=Phenylobacterium sp. TaxID=1871053 RepID=UPI002E36BB53|nr:AraC family transcriptional regulator [Phenylobacterium sp.]
MPTSISSAAALKLPGAGDAGIYSPGADERVYPAQKIAVMLDALAREGIVASHALAAVGLSELEAADPATRVSLTQVIICLRNAVRLSSDPMFAYRIGLHFHMSTYGMYGFAMLSSMDFRQTMRFAERYHQLAAPLVDMAFTEEDGLGIWTLEPKSHPQMDASLYRQVVEMYFGIHTSLHRDIMGPEFAPSELRVIFEAPSDPNAYAGVLGAPVRFRQPQNQLRFDARRLDHRPSLGNALTYAAVLEVCDRFVDELQRRAGIVGTVRHLLLTNLMRNLSLEDVARDLGTSVRTLRRRLADEGASYRQLTDELRRDVAINYLRETDMTVEDIAYALGFSDAANFRQAFRRWTSATPQQFRAARSGAGEVARASAEWPRSTAIVAEPNLGRERPRRRSRRSL